MTGPGVTSVTEQARGLSDIYAGAFLLLVLHGDKTFVIQCRRVKISGRTIPVALRGS
ncbi:MAG: hypothetical protein KAY24_00695 [Candidatus Eisenbacteria sp.]|nr:hypothetical protein [Candidatus Eisenbacteria bacterium]